MNTARGALDCPLWHCINGQNFLWEFIRKHSNALRMRKSYMYVANLELTWQYPLIEFHPKQRKAVYVT